MVEGVVEKGRGMISCSARITVDDEKQKKKIDRQNDREKSRQQPKVEAYVQHFQVLTSPDP